MSDKQPNKHVEEIRQSMSELSLRKQLSLRQQREKPMLKYRFSDPSMPIAQSPTSLTNGVSNGAVLVSEKAHSAAEDKMATNGGSPNGTSVGNGKKTSTYSYIDPYSRPFTPKDMLVEERSQRPGSAIHRTGSIGQTKSILSSATAISSGITGEHAFSARHNNSFLRGQPKAHPTHDYTNPVGLIRNETNLLLRRDSNASCSSASSSGDGSNCSTMSAKQKFEASLLAKPSLSSDQQVSGNSSSGSSASSPVVARGPSAVRRPQSGYANPNYTPVKPYSEVKASPTSEVTTPVPPVNPEIIPSSVTSAKTNGTSTAETPYYRKYFKPEEKINTDKPEVKTVGSTSRVTRPHMSTNTATGESTAERIATEKPYSDKPTSDSHTQSKGNGASTKPVNGEAPTYNDFIKYVNRQPTSIKNVPKNEIITTGVGNGIGDKPPAGTVANGQIPKGSENGFATTPKRLPKNMVNSNGSSKQVNGNGSYKQVADLSDDDEEGDEFESFSPSISERSPDGITEEFLDDEDDMLDNLDDDNDVIGPDDDEQSSSNGSPMSSTPLHNRPHSATTLVTRKHLGSAGPPSGGASGVIRMKSAKKRAQSSYVDNQGVQPALIESNFSNVPPYINFVSVGQRVEQLPWDYRKLLKWRMCTITPNVVKNTVARSGFRPTRKSHDWLGCWGKHMKALGFKGIREYQMLNHFPGSFQMGRKDRLWKNLQKLQIQFGKKEFNFFPQTFCLPGDSKQLKRAWDDSSPKQKWIVKPPASARGIGIKVINKWNQIPRKRAVIVQRYLGRPYLINDSKFDLRVYVYVTCYDPLRIYVYEDGLARFASSKYSHAMKNIGNKFMHLTNYSINKRNSEYTPNSDDTVCQGHKWSLKSLWGYLQKKGINTNEVWRNIKDLVVKTVISSESAVNGFIKANVKSRYSVHELFGFDVLLDEHLHPYVLEVNISPSLHSNSQLDINIKGEMIKDLHNLAGFRLPNKAEVVLNQGPDVSKPGHFDPICLDKRLYAQTLCSDEKAKHVFYCQRANDELAMRSIGDILTPDDLRILIESIDEDSRKGGFQRVFPTPSTHKYLQYFDSPRYYNLLLDQWCQKFNRMEVKGISLIEAACMRKIHLHNPTENGHHQWVPPSSRPSMSSAISQSSRSGPDFLSSKKPYSSSLSSTSDMVLTKPPLSSALSRHASSAMRPPSNAMRYVPKVPVMAAAS